MRQAESHLWHTLSTSQRCSTASFPRARSLPSTIPSPAHSLINRGVDSSQSPKPGVDRYVAKTQTLFSHPSAPARLELRTELSPTSSASYCLTFPPHLPTHNLLPAQHRLFCSCIDCIAWYTRTGCVIAKSKHRSIVVCQRIVIYRTSCHTSACDQPRQCTAAVIY